MEIQLLDGSRVSKAELLTKMEDDNYYYGELSTKVLSSSSVSQLLKSPKI